MLRANGVVLPQKNAPSSQERNPFNLIVPSTAILWAGPYLSDLAHRLKGRDGHVRVPSADGGFLAIGGKPIGSCSIERVPLGEATARERSDTPVPETAIRLPDVAGYEDVRRQIDDRIIWPEKHRQILHPTSRSSGVLFFGPPGCGKSRWARAIAGELEQEVRLLGPSDLIGAYIGWGQIMIREQFDWLAENDKRMLIIDELDAVARSRRETQMHADEKSCVNELLVQLDRVLRAGRLVVATTNFVRSMDDSVLRSGRFGQFIPVPPPDLAESAAILAYYLNRLVALCAKQAKMTIKVPDALSLCANGCSALPPESRDRKPSLWCRS